MIPPTSHLVSYSNSLGKLISPHRNEQKFTSHPPKKTLLYFLNSQRVTHFTASEFGFNRAVPPLNPQCRMNTRNPQIFRKQPESSHISKDFLEVHENRFLRTLLWPNLFCFLSLDNWEPGLLPANLCTTIKCKRKLSTSPIVKPILCNAFV